jgi:hypothetical protein
MMTTVPVYMALRSSPWYHALLGNMELYQVLSPLVMEENSAYGLITGQHCSCQRTLLLIYQDRPRTT